MLRYLRLGWVFLRLAALNELAYRSNFFVQAFQALLGLATGLLGLLVIFQHTRTLGGWTPDELLALLGIYTLVLGLIGMVIEPSLERFIGEVREGTLDFVLTKPVDAQFLVSVKEIQVWKCCDVAVGLAVLVIALLRMGSGLSFSQVLAFLAALLAGGVIVYSFWIILATSVFWFIKVENILVVFQSVYVAGRWPVGLYPSWMRYALTFLVPVAFAVTVPAEALVGRLQPWTLVGSLAAALGLFLFARWFWKLGVRSYAGASA